MLTELLPLLVLLHAATSFICYKAWMGHNNDSTVPHDYRYYIDQVECLNNTKCALFIWRTTGNTWFTIASSDCITSEHECKEGRRVVLAAKYEQAVTEIVTGIVLITMGSLQIAKECCITSTCSEKGRRMFLSLVKRYNATVWTT